MTENENKQAGLSINKKTIVLICILLAGIMAFAGVLTQVLPRGIYETNPDYTMFDEMIAKNEALKKVDGLLGLK